jgi:NADH-quinone oxidoreductase subunit L
VQDLIWLVPALPLAGFAILVVGGRRLGEPLAGWFATFMITASFAASVAVYITARGSAGGEEHRLTQTLFTWISAGGFKAEVGLLADPLSITMCLFITGIGALIHLYSIGYMHGDARFSTFFAYMNLFVFSMLMLVLGDNLLITFLGWEGVGACSYFLISFWFDKEGNASAGKKAFITNRIGDVGFMAAMFLTFASVGSISYATFLPDASRLATTTVTAIALLLFIGAVGKSAQLPLMVWLPDAMAGPTPVSALIHAATMVTAGVYLMVRVNPLLGQAADWLPTLIAVVGVVTALFAASIAIAQNDIKKVLAYSTVSQLGYMFLAVGSGAYVAAIFHVITHAFFKALLFLGAGSVIHGMDDEQDMRRMGGLFKLMPITAVTFIFGWLAIAGVPPFAGFFSKDDVLLYAYEKSPILWFVGLVAAFLTAFYMSRQVILVFFGKPRWDEAATEATGDEPEQSAAEVTPNAEAGDSEPAPTITSASVATSVEHGDAAGGHSTIHPHESSWLMTLPLVVLAGGAALAEVVNLPFQSKIEFLQHWLEPVVGANEAQLHVATGGKILLATLAGLFAAAGIAGAVRVYVQRKVSPSRIETPALAHAWYYDSSIAAFAGGPGRRLFDAMAWFDRTIIDGAVNGVAGLVRGSGGEVRRLQTGFVRNYALGLAVGAILLVGALLSRGVF